MDCYGAVCAVSGLEYGGWLPGVGMLDGGYTGDGRVLACWMAACCPVRGCVLAWQMVACWPVTCNALQATNVRRLGRLCSVPYAFFVTSRGLS